MIEYIVHDERGAGLRTKVARVLLRQGMEVRLAEVRMPQHSEAPVLDDRALAGLWRAARPVDMGWWLGASQRRYRTYYQNILVQVHNARLMDGDLDTIIAAGLQAIGQSTEKAAEFADWRAKLELQSQHLRDDMGAKRDLLALMTTWATAGIVAGL